MDFVERIENFPMGTIGIFPTYSIIVLLSIGAIGHREELEAFTRLDCADVKGLPVVNDDFHVEQVMFLLVPQCELYHLFIVRVRVDIVIQLIFVVWRILNVVFHI